MRERGLDAWATIAFIPVLRARVSISMNVSMTLRVHRFRYGLLPGTWTWVSGSPYDMAQTY